MNEVTLRLCSPSDERNLRRIAERDCAEIPAALVLGAETGGVLIAAVEVASGRVVADPFNPTADAVELLRRRAAQIRRAERGRGPSSPPWLRRRPGGSAAPAAGEAG